MNRFALPARLALAIRRAVFVPGGRLEGFYQRRIRPWARHLLPRPPPARLGRVAAWPSPAIAPGQVRTLLIIKLDHIGDFILAIPAYTLLRRSFPAVRITLLCGPWNHDIATRSGLFDAVIPFAAFAPQAEAARPAIDLRTIASLGPFDLAIDLRVDEDTRPILARAAARVKAGYASPGVALDIELPRPVTDPAARADTQSHQRQWMLNLAAAVLAQDLDAQTGSLLLHLAPSLPDSTAWPRPVIALNTGSGRAIKNWPLPRFTELARRLRAEWGATILLLGTSGQSADAAAMVSALGGQGVIDLTGKLPLDAAIAAIVSSDGFIGNDTALGHASAALGKPTLVLFSGIDPLPNWAPLGPRAAALKAEVSCSPCHLSDLALCPNGHLCMEVITVEHAWAALSGWRPTPGATR